MEIAKTVCFLLLLQFVSCFSTANSTNQAATEEEAAFERANTAEDRVTDELEEADIDLAAEDRGKSKMYCQSKWNWYANSCKHWSKMAGKPKSNSACEFEQYAKVKKCMAGLEA